MLVRRDRPPTVAAGGALVVHGQKSEVREEILRLAAATGVAAHTCAVSDLTPARWAEPDLVVIDSDCAESVGPSGLPRRAGVVLAGRQPPDSVAWASAVRLGAEQVLELPVGEASLVDRLHEAVSGSASLGALVAVMGGCGGAGATTLAVALALSAARSGREPVLVGADPWDGGIDIELGAEAVPGPRWPELAGVSGRLSTDAILDGLPQIHGVRFLSSDRQNPSRIPLPALSAVIDSARRTGGSVVVDLPRDCGESARWIGTAVDLGLVVVPPTVSGALSARVAVVALGWPPDSFGLVVRAELGRDVHDNALEEAVGLPILARLQEDQQVRSGRRRGEPPGYRARGRMARTCAGLWDLVHKSREPDR